MRRPVVAANWKMNGIKSEAKSLVKSITNEIDVQSTSASCVLTPPSIYLEYVGSLLNHSMIELGAQNISQHLQGAFTGEISGKMIQDVGCRYVLVGHSERRSIYGESDEIVALKFQAAVNAGLIPILCVGESLAQREKNLTSEIVISQIAEVLNRVDQERFLNSIIAYEPVWAIGTGKTATPQQAQEVHYTIRQYLRTRIHSHADLMRIIYGGSVKSNNARELFAEPDIDGGLIGGASLDADEFIKIYHSARI